jgi:outer membrane lipoprotein carrier protein LolA
VNSTRRALLVGSVLLLWAPRPAWAAGPIDDLLARIARARAPVRTLKGGFTQTRTIGLLSTEVRSVGKLALLRPDRLRWELGPPDDVTFWAGPEGLSYKSAHGQGRLAATSARMGAALEDLHAVLGGDLASLRERWSLSVLRDDASGAEIEATLHAADASTGDSRAARRMRFALASDLVRPTRALLVEGEHDRTVIEFGELVVNAPIDESVMRPPV